MKWVLVLVSEITISFYLYKGVNATNAVNMQAARSCCKQISKIMYHVTYAMLIKIGEMDDIVDFF